jgi:putative hydrolase of the HAD superfamily
MVSRKYSHIFFDLDNTLWDFKTNSYHAMQAAFHHFSFDKNGIEYENFFEVYSKHNQKLWEDYRQQKVTKTDLKQRRFQYTFNELKIIGANAEAMNTFYLDEIPKQTHLIDGAEELLRYLKNKGFTLHIITNGFKEVQYKKLETSGLEKYFTKVFISEDVKAPKPDRKIFEYAIKSANAPKNKSLMVGDDFGIDVKGALNFGIDAVFFNPGRKNSIHEQPVIERSDDNYREITALPELINIL